MSDAPGTPAPDPVGAPAAAPAPAPEPHREASDDAGVPPHRDPALRRYLGGWWTSGLLAAALAVSTAVAGAGDPGWPTFLAVVAVIGISQLVEVRLTVGRTTVATDVSAVGVVVALVVLPLHLVPLALLLGQVLPGLTYRHTPVKMGYNAAVSATGAVVATGAAAGLLRVVPLEVVDLTTALGLVVAAAAVGAHETTNALAIRGLLRRLDPPPPATVARERTRALTTGMASTAAFGLLVGVLVQAAPHALPVLLVLGTGMHLALAARARQVASDVEHHARLERTVAGASDGIALLDADGNLELANDSFVRLLGIAGDPRGRTLADAVTPAGDRAGNLVTTLGQLSADHPVATTEVRLRDRVVTANLGGIVDGTGGVTGAVMVLRDVTATRELEALRSDFLARVSHELRTPLTAISGFVETLRARFDDLSRGEVLDFLDVVDRHSSRLERLVSTLLWSSRIEAAGLQAVPEAVALRAGVGDAIEASGLRLTEPVEVDVDDLRVLVDRHHLVQMLENLLSNAAKYGAGPIAVDARREGTEVIVTVSDAGRGVPQEFEDQLFEPFWQASSGDRRTAEGMGLGLSIVDGLARQNEGSVAYRRDADRTRFELRLPVAPPRGAGPHSDRETT